MKIIELYYRKILKKYIPFLRLRVMLYRLVEFKIGKDIISAGSLVNKSILAKVVINDS